MADFEDGENSLISSFLLNPPPSLHLPTQLDADSNTTKVIPERKTGLVRKLRAEATKATLIEGLFDECIDRPEIDSQWSSPRTTKSNSSTALPSPYLSSTLSRNCSQELNSLKPTGRRKSGTSSPSITPRSNFGETQSRISSSTPQQSFSPSTAVTSSSSLLQPQTTNIVSNSSELFETLVENFQQGLLVNQLKSELVASQESYQKSQQDLQILMAKSREELQTELFSGLDISPQILTNLKNRHTKN